MFRQCVDGLADAGVCQNVDMFVEADEWAKLLQEAYQDWNRRRILERTCCMLQDLLLNCCNLLLVVVVVVSRVDSNGRAMGW